MAGTPKIDTTSSFQAGLARRNIERALALLDAIEKGGGLPPRTNRQLLKSASEHLQRAAEAAKEGVDLIDQNKYDDF